MVTQADRDKSARGLILLSRERSSCPLCGKELYRGETSYNFLEAVVIGDPETRRMVRHGRKHCLDHHEQYPLWNLVPRQEFKKKTTADPKPIEDIDGMVDSLVFLSMINAAKVFPINSTMPVGDINPEMVASKLIGRISIAIGWLRWVFPRRDQLRNSLANSAEVVQSKTKQLLEEFHASACTFVYGEAFKRLFMVGVNRALILNELQLLSFKPGRFRVRPFFAFHHDGGTLSQAGNV
jgi:hypothetical protein